KSGCWHAGRCTKIEFKGCFLSVVYHKLHAFNSQDISNFVRIGNRCNGTMLYGNPGKFTGNQHGTFNMNMCIYKTRKDVMINIVLFCFYTKNLPICNGDFSFKNTLVLYVDNVSF